MWIRPKDRRYLPSTSNRNTSLGLYSFYRDKYPAEKKFYDFIPTLLEMKYLKTIDSCHECANTLNVGDLDGDWNNKGS
jgi:hypothetical protein